MEHGSFQVGRHHGNTPLGERSQPFTPDYDLRESMAVRPGRSRLPVEAIVAYRPIVKPVNETGACHLVDTDHGFLSKGMIRPGAITHSLGRANGMLP